MIIQNNQFPLNNKDCVLNIQGIADTNDKSPSAHTVTNNGVTITTPANNNFNSMSFNGTSDYLEIADSAGFNVSSKLVLSAWVRLDVINTAKVIIGKWNSATDNRSYLFYLGSDNKLRFKNSNDGSEPPAPTMGGTALSVDTWYHVAVVFDNSDGTYIYYLNGINDGGGTSEYPIYDSTSKLLIGIFENGLSLEYPGNLQNIQIINRAIYTRNFTPPNRIA